VLLSINGIRNYTFDTLQHQLIGIISSTLDHLATSVHACIIVVTCLDVCIIYFISCDYDEFFVILYNILKLLSLIGVKEKKNIYVRSKHA
jgi:hypothetical protein